MKHDRKSQRAQICFSLLWWESAFTASFQYFSNHARSSNYSNLVRLDVNTNKVASQLQGPSWKMCSVDKSFTIVTLSLELFDEINVDLHLAKFKVTSSSQLWLDACATGSRALHFALQTCQNNSIKISTSSSIRLRGYCAKHKSQACNFVQWPIPCILWITLDKLPKSWTQMKEKHSITMSQLTAWTRWAEGKLNPGAPVQTGECNCTLKSSAKRKLG